MAKKKIRIKRIAGLIAVSVPMLWFGSSLYSPNQADNEMEIKVGSHTIRNAQFKAILASRVAQASEIAGVDLAADETTVDLIADELRNQLASRLIFFEMLSDLGLNPTEQEIYRKIGGLEDFQDEGKFSRARFKAKVADEKEFVEQVREQIKYERIFWLTSVSAVADTALIEKIAHYFSSTRKVSKHKIDTQEFLSKDGLGEADVIKYYQDNRNRYIEPERAEFEYVEISRDELAQQMEVDEEELREAYKLRKSNSSRREERQLQLIVLADEEAATGALERARALPDKFSELAEVLSEDSGSRELGGDLGFLSREDLDSGLAEDVFSARIGEILGPYESDGQWQIFKVNGVIGRSERTFDELRDTLLREVRLDKAAVRLEELGMQLEEAALNEDNGLNAAVQSLGLDLKRSGEVVKRPATLEDNPEKFRDPQVLAELFDEEFLDSQDVSGLISDGIGRYLIARVTDHSPSRILSLDEGEQRIREDAEQALALANAIKHAGELAQKLANGETDLSGSFLLSADLKIDEDQENLPAGFYEEDVVAAFGGNFAGSSLPVYTVVVSPTEKSVSLLRIDGITFGQENEKVHDNVATMFRSAQSVPLELALLEELSRRYDIHLGRVTP